MPNTKFLRDLLHDMANIMVGIQGSLENVNLSQIEPGPTRDYIKEALERSRKLCAHLTAAQQELCSSYKKTIPHTKENLC